MRCDYGPWSGKMPKGLIKILLLKKKQKSDQADPRKTLQEIAKTTCEHIHENVIFRMFLH